MQSASPARSLWRRRCAAAFVSSPSSAAVRAPHLTVRRPFSVIQRGHDRERESLYAKLGFAKDGEAHRLHRTPEELQQGFVREAMKLQDPIHNDTDRARLEELKEALVLLRDPAFRQRYNSHYYNSNDAQLHVLQDGGQVAANYNPEHLSFNFVDHTERDASRALNEGGAKEGAPGARRAASPSLGDFGDAFRHATGAGPAPADARVHRAAEVGAAVNGGDIAFLLKITFEESMAGCSRAVEVRRHVRCRRCEGAGRLAVKKPRKCPVCSGRGSTVLPSADYHMERRCHHCLGLGTMPAPPCAVCDGSGLRMHQTAQTTVSVPAGALNMSTFRIPQRGHDGVRGGRAGDLVLTVMVSEHHHFYRHEGDLHAVLPIPLATALLGGVVSVPTLAGGAAATAPLRVPPCVRNGQRLPLALYGTAPPPTSSTNSCSSTAPVNIVFHAMVVIPRADRLTGRQKMALGLYEAATAEAVAAAEASGSNAGDERTSAAFRADVPGDDGLRDGAEPFQSGAARPVRTPSSPEALSALHAQSAALKAQYKHWFTA